MNNNDIYIYLYLRVHRDTSELLSYMYIFWGVQKNFCKSLYIYILKTELRILDFQHFHWLAEDRLSAHIPALPNMVNENINKESWIKTFPRNWRPLKIV